MFSTSANHDWDQFAVEHNDADGIFIEYVGYVIVLLMLSWPGLSITRAYEVGFI